MTDDPADPAVTIDDQRNLSAHRPRHLLVREEVADLLLATHPERPEAVARAPSPNAEGESHSVRVHHALPRPVRQARRLSGADPRPREIGRASCKERLEIWVA